MPRIQESIDLKVPAHIAYQQLSRFEDYPRFMEEVDAVQRLDDGHLHWTTTMANRPVEWDAEITEQEPERCIAWRNTSGPTNSGRVEVQPAGADASRVTLTLESDAEQVPGSMEGYGEQDMAQRLRLDLARMKDFIEERGNGNTGNTGNTNMQQSAQAQGKQQGERGSPRNSPVATSSYAAGSEGFSGEEVPDAPMVSAAQPAATQGNDSAGSARPHATDAQVNTGPRKVRERGEFPIEQPMDALRADHHLVRKLFDRYFRAQEAEEKKDVGTHLLLLLEMHTSLEDSIFYPRVQEADPALVEHCTQEHEHATQLVDRLKLMDESDPQAIALFHELADAIFAHVQEEEQKLFPKVQQAGLDLAAIGREMHAFETRMIAARMQKPAAPGLRQ